MTVELIPAANAIIGFPTARLVATPSMVPEIGHWQDAYPVGQMLSLPISHVARSASLDPEDTQAAVIYDQDVKIGAVFLIRHNISAAGMIRVRVCADAAMTSLLWDSGWILAWEPAFDLGSASIDWEGGRLWDRTYTAAEMRGRSWDRRILLPESMYGRAIHVAVDDQQNPDGFVKIGFLEGANALQVPLNYSFGGKYGFRGRSKIQEAEGGTKYGTRLPKPRSLTVQFDRTDHTFALTNYLEMMDQLDIVEPFYIWPEPQDPISGIRTAMFGAFTEINQIELTDVNADTVAFSVEEWI